MFCLRIYDFLKFCAVHLSEPVLEPNRTGRTGSKLFCTGSGSVLANELRFWFSVLKKWSENRTEPNFSNTRLVWWGDISEVEFTVNVMTIIDGVVKMIRFSEAIGEWSRFRVCVWCKTRICVWLVSGKQ